MLIEAKKLAKRIFQINSHKEFEEIALAIFRLQSNHVPIYKNYLKHLNIVSESVQTVNDIPFLPIEFFKSQQIQMGNEEAQAIFESSGTTGSITSKHIVGDLEIYDQSSKQNFEAVFGAISDYCILALLPSYLERGNSSLVYMTKRFMEWSNHVKNGFFLDDFDLLKRALMDNEKQGQKTLLIGVTFGLLDFAENQQLNLKNTVVIETGGMKGRKKEMVRKEVHSELKNAFGVDFIGSEYGMTELLSQAWSKQDGIFYCPDWMEVRIREINDPFAIARMGKTGGVNIIDLANIYSCSFIATSDLGKKHSDGGFEILGRYDNSDIRGCNLMTLSD